MKKYLLPEIGNFYKANLHCHTTVSDGKWTPQQVKENYKAQGYSIVAYTDHDVFVTHNELQDESFLPLNGYEICFSKAGERKVCHVCLIALEQNRKIQNCYCKSYYIDKNISDCCLNDNGGYPELKYDTVFISKVLDECRKDDFFVTYNHPIWSMETKDEYCNYHGMHAMEVVNYGCVTEGYDDCNENIYDQMLRGGEKLYCIATDDNHNAYSSDHPKNDSFGGFTCIKAPRLEYADIANALLNGDFYSSEGPSINELYCEDGKIHISCSEAVRIVMSSENRAYDVATAEKIGETITEADFDVGSDRLGTYVRFTVVDREGKRAYTNAYFRTELIN